MKKFIVVNNLPVDWHEAKTITKNIQGIITNAFNAQNKNQDENDEIIFSLSEEFKITEKKSIISIDIEPPLGKTAKIRNNKSKAITNFIEATLDNIEGFKFRQRSIFYYLDPKPLTVI